MRHWWQVGTRNWRAKPVRTLLATASIALGVALVTWVTCCYESVRRSVTDAVVHFLTPLADHPAGPNDHTRPASHSGARP